MTAFYHVRRARPSDRARILSLQLESPSGSLGESLAESLADGSLAAVDDAGVVAALLDEPARTSTS